jgi:outer membrane receptor protein involved in Fe transport
MKKIITLFTLIFLAGLPSLSRAQEATGKIQGLVISQDKTPVEFANVVLRKAGERDIVKVSVTDPKGNFEFAGLPYGSYSIQLSFIGYKEFTTDLLVLSQAVLALSPLMMELEAKVLKEVQVSSQKPLVERKIDRTVINVESSIMSAGASAMDVLEKSPGVSVDKDGNVSLRGKEGVMVFIDGRSTYLSGGDLANLLRNMQASQLDQIELMTNPPAQYDAAGNAGVINIRTKKIQMKGFNGSYTAAYVQGRFPGYNQSASFNYRKGHFNLFSNLAYSNRDGFEQYDILRNMREEGSNTLQTIYDQQTYSRTNNQSLNGKLGLDYSLGERTILGAVVSGYHNPGDAQTDNLTLLKYPDGTLYTSVVSPATSRQKWQNGNVDLNFRHTFDTSGRELSADVNYLIYNTSSQQAFTNSFFGADGLPNQERTLLENHFPQHIRIYSGKVDYVQPLGSGSKLELGAKTSFVTTDNDARFYKRLENRLVPNNLLSNHFVYQENINALYLNYRKTIRKWEVQVGLRTEQTSSQGEQRTTNQRTNRNYTQLFPTAYLSYTLNDKHQFGLSYGRRVKRPDYQDLNPFQIFLDQYTYEKGNPFLQPQYSHNLELTHILMEGAVSTTFSYSQTTDMIQPTIRQNTSRNETFLIPENLSRSQVWGASVNAELPVTNFSSAMLYLEYTHNQFEGTINNGPFALRANTLSGNLLYQIKFGRGWTAELAGWYTSRSIEGTFLLRPYGRVAAAIRKNVLKNRGSFRLSANDIFRWTKYEGTSQYQNIDIFMSNRWQTQTVKLTFTYQFRKGSKVEPREYNSSSSEAQERVKTGDK